MSRTKTTTELEPGDRVRLTSSVVRTVAAVTPAGYLNYRNQPVSVVTYAEPWLDVWSRGNTGAPDSVWHLA